MTAKNKILKSLKDNGGLTTSRLASLNGLNYAFTLKNLSELKKDKFVDNVKSEFVTIWEITKKGLIFLKQNNFKKLKGGKND